MFSRSKSRTMFPIRLPPCFHQFHYVSIPLPPYIHSIYIGSHTCTSWFDCMPRFSGSMVWLCNICWASMYRLSPHVWTPYKPISYRVRREKAQCYSALCQKYHIFWEKRKGKTSLLPWWGSTNTTNKKLKRIIQRKLWVLLWKPCKTLE
jgi:hypothetical protein